MFRLRIMPANNLEILAAASAAMFVQRISSVESGLVNRMGSTSAGAGLLAGGAGPGGPKDGVVPKLPGGGRAGQAKTGEPAGAGAGLSFDDPAPRTDKTPRPTGGT